jgi:multiple sugar transport system substrate-binding protein
MRAIGWDHPRCVEPMLAASAAWHELTGVTVAWEFRPLAAFNDQPLHELAPDYDLLVIDHPAIAEAVEHGALRPLEELLPEERVRRLTREAVGPSGDSYRWDGATWALAVDAACHVSARRPRLLEQLGEEEPRTWPQVLDLARRRPGCVALPLLPADALCALLSIAASHGQAPTLEEPAPEGAIALLAELAPLLHAGSWSCAPPRLLGRMTAGEPIAYVPLIFGYSGLAGDQLRYGDVPAGPDGLRAPILGGAGLAVSAATRDPGLAAGFAAWLCEESAQRTLVLGHGGQPAHAAVWAEPGQPGADRARPGPAVGFLRDTCGSMAAAFSRPAHPAWPAFHHDAGVALAGALAEGEQPAALARRLRMLAQPLTVPPRGRVTPPPVVAARVGSTW